jgi:hypothetical protein
MKSWSDSEIESRGGEEPYWMYTKILALQRGDECLTEEFDIQIERDGDRKSFAYSYKDRTFITFFTGKDRLEYIPISTKEYDEALLECIKTVRQSIVGV